MSHLPADTLGEIFSSVLREIVSKLSGISLEPLPGKYGELHGIVGIISIQSGESVFISAEEEHIRVLCTYMLGISESEISADDICDAMYELVNISLGSAKTRLSVDLSVTASIAAVLRGAQMSMVNKEPASLFSQVLAGGGIAVNLQVCCQ